MSASSCLRLAAEDIFVNLLVAEGVTGVVGEETTVICDIAMREPASGPFTTGFVDVARDATGFGIVITFANDFHAEAATICFARVRTATTRR